VKIGRMYFGDRAGDAVEVDVGAIELSTAFLRIGLQWINPVLTVASVFIEVATAEPSGM